MGTRSITTIQDESGNALTTIYGQWDGYPGGHGADLKACCPTELVNGIPGDKTEKMANGMGCLAATVIGGLKQHIGGIYLYPPGKNGVWENYVYTLSPSPARFLDVDERGSVQLKIEEQHGDALKVIYEGPIKDFEPGNVEEAA